MKSIITEEKKCYICGSRVCLESHHVFSGVANRKKSEEYGLKVPLCHWCHNEPPNGVHHNKAVREKLQRTVQEIAMNHYGWTTEEFIKIFGKNYI